MRLALTKTTSELLFKIQFVLSKNYQHNIIKKTKTTLKALIMLIMLNMIQVSEARNARPNIHSFSDAEKLELLGLIELWLTEDFISNHGDNLSKFYTSNDFLRWYRDHLQDLEEFILEQGQVQNKNFAKYVPLPKWNPDNDVPAYFNGFDPAGNPFNNISPKCNDANLNTGCRTREDYYNTYPGFKFNQYGTFYFLNGLNVIDLSPLPDFLWSNQTMCDVTSQISGARTYTFRNPTDFGDFMRYEFNNNGHMSFDISPTGLQSEQSQMGNLNSNRGSAVYIWWLWYAWIDDIWWDYDANCRHENNGTTITGAYTEASGFTVGTGSTRILGTSGNVHKVQGKITIEPGATLIIENGQVLEILDDYFTNQSCDIEVMASNSAQPGGRLIIRTGATIRGITSMGESNGAVKSTDINGNNIYPEDRLYYSCRWPGIKVFGVPTESAFSMQHGRVEIDGSGGRITIQRAYTAIKSENGGVIECKDADFIDCRTAIYMKDYISPHDHKVNISRFERTNFIVKDQVSKYFTNDNYYAGYKRDFHKYKQVILENMGVINFGGCEFRNDDPNIFDGTVENERGTAIFATNAMIACHKDGNQTPNPKAGCPSWTGNTVCLFKGWSYGIKSSETTQTNGQNPDIGVQEAKFINCLYSVNCGKGVARLFLNQFDYLADNANPLNNAPFLNAISTHHEFFTGDQNEMTLILQNQFNSEGENSTNVNILNSSTAYNTKVLSNNFKNNKSNLTDALGVICEGDNSNTKVECNNFTAAYSSALKFLNGPVQDQGGPTQRALNSFDATSPCLPTAYRNVEAINVGPRFTYWDNFIPCTNGGGPTPKHLILPFHTFILIAPNITGETDYCKVSCEGFYVNRKEINKTQNIVNIYPNPGDGTIQLDWKTEQKPSTITIYNSMGTIIYENSQLPSQIDLKSQASGIYIIKIVSSNHEIQTLKYNKVL